MCDFARLDFCLRKIHCLWTVFLCYMFRHDINVGVDKYCLHFSMTYEQKSYTCLVNRLQVTKQIAEMYLMCCKQWHKYLIPILESMSKDR